MKCKICKEEIKLELRGDTTQEEAWHQVHANQCILNGVEDDLEAIRRRITFIKIQVTTPKVSRETRLANLKWNKEHRVPTYRYE